MESVKGCKNAPFFLFWYFIRPPGLARFLGRFYAFLIWLALFLPLASFQSCARWLVGWLVCFLAIAIFLAALFFWSCKGFFFGLLSCCRWFVRLLPAVLLSILRSFALRFWPLPILPGMPGNLCPMAKIENFTFDACAKIWPLCFPAKITIGKNENLAFMRSRKLSL